MKNQCISAAIVALLLCASVAFAHEQPLKGKLTLTITGINGNVVSFNVNGRLTSFFRTNGSGTLTVDNSGGFTGSATLSDFHGDQLFIEFAGLIGRDANYIGTFTVTGGTGHWIGHIGGGAMNGSTGDASIVAFLDGTVDH